MTAGDQLVEVRIGVIADFDDDPKKKIADGILASAQAAVDRRRQDLHRHGLAVTVLHESDHGRRSHAPQAARALQEMGCIAVIGPCDSASMAKVLEIPELADFPKLATMATATPLARLGRRASFFRFTPNDRTRVQYLIEQAGDKLGRNVIVYSQSDGENSYSAELAEDVRRELEGHGRRCRHIPVPKLHSIPVPDATVSSVIICAPSLSAIHIMGQIRGAIPPTLFAFGSNSNLLKKEALGAIVVADLNRTDSRPAISRALASIDHSVSEPSIATMCATEAVVNILLARPAADWSSTASARRLLVEALEQPLLAKGLRGAVKFDEDHEMVGSEGLYILQIGQCGNGFEFLPWSEQDIPIRAAPRRSAFKRYVWSVGLLLALLLAAYLLTPLFDDVAMSVVVMYGTLLGAAAFIVMVIFDQSKH